MELLRSKKVASLALEIVDTLRRIVEVYANYYDEAESDLATVATQPAPLAAQTAVAPATGSEVRAVPQTALLIAIVILALLLESTLLVRRAQPVGARHV